MQHTDTGDRHGAPGIRMSGKIRHQGKNFVSIRKLQHFLDTDFGDVSCNLCKLLSGFRGGVPAFRWATAGKQDTTAQTNQHECSKDSHVRIVAYYELRTSRKSALQAVIYILTQQGTE